MLSLLNLSFGSSMGTCERLLEEQQPHDIAQKVLLDSHNPMQYEVEMLISTFCRTHKAIALSMLDTLKTIIDDKMAAAARALAEPHQGGPISMPLSPVVVLISAINAHRSSISPAASETA
jgi:hypothetical protein